MEENANRVEMENAQDHPSGQKYETAPARTPSSQVLPAHDGLTSVVAWALLAATLDTDPWVSAVEVSTKEKGGQEARCGSGVKWKNTPKLKVESYCLFGGNF